MSNLQQWQQKIQEKRKQTPWRDFVMEICSWHPGVFYRRGKFISRFPQTSRCEQVTSYTDFFDTAPYYQVEYNSQSSSYANLAMLWRLIPKPNFINYGGTENCEYSDIVWGCKNSYLSSTIITDCENIFYSSNVKEGAKNIYNSVMARNSVENIYSSKGILNSLNVFYSYHVNNSHDVWFSYNLIGCNECIRCHDLQNQSYCIDNISYSQSDYFAKKFDLLKTKEYFELRYQAVKPKTSPSYCVESSNCLGDFLYYSNQITNGHYVFNVNKGNNLMFIGGSGDNEDMYDLFSGASGSNNHLYACTSLGAGASHVYCSAHCLRGNAIFYSYFMRECDHCLGCIGLTNKSYCILNKQYTKEEWYEKVDEIFSQMDQDGTLGQFFPATMNPFYFNDTAAYLIDPSFTKEEVIAAGYLWRDEPIKVDIPDGVDIVKVEELEKYEGFDDQGNRTINADILKKVIQDEQGNYYRIIPMEYKFLMKHGLPLPRKHWLERMKENFRINGKLFFNSLI